MFLINSATHKHGMDSCLFLDKIPELILDNTFDPWMVTPLKNCLLFHEAHEKVAGRKPLCERTVW